MIQWNPVNLITGEFRLSLNRNNTIHYKLIESFKSWTLSVDGKARSSKQQDWRFPKRNSPRQRHLTKTHFDLVSGPWRRTFCAMSWMFWRLKLINFKLCECALFRMNRIGSLFPLAIVAFGLFNMIMFLSPDKVRSSLIHYVEYWHNLFHFSITYLPDLPTSKISSTLTTSTTSSTSSTS